MKNKKIYKFLEKTDSIKSRIILSYAVIILLMFIPLTLMFYNSIKLSNEYNNIINNVNYANATKLTENIKSKIGNVAWDIMAGITTFEKTDPYLIVTKINNNLEYLKEHASTNQNKNTMDVAIRTLKTLTTYIDKLKKQIDEEAPVDESEQTVEEIRRVASNIYDFEQDFIMKEVMNASSVNEKIQSTQNIVIIAAILSIFLAFIFAYLTLSSLMDAIGKPIMSLDNFAKTIANGNFNEKAEIPKVKELFELTNSLNAMAIKLEKLINDSVEDQQNLKKAEIKTLQAQITPHFLYNTLDTIVWLAEEKKYKEVIDITRAFSMYFRISLSKGDDFIPISKEIAHAKNYLTIQKIRYRDILNYEIDVDDGIEDISILKLLLQPLIENAIYHGVKNKREPGNVKVIAKALGEFIHFEIKDTGKGIDEKNIEEIYKNILSPNMSKNGGYGLYNVNQRLILYYGFKCCLKIESHLNYGTTVSFNIPSKGRC